MAASNIKLWITGSKIPFEVEAIGSTTTFGQVKEKIKQAINVEPSRQILYYNEVELEDEMRVSEIVHEACGELMLEVVPLGENPRVTVYCVSPNKDVEWVKIRESDSVDDLKRKLSRTWGFPSNKISITRCGFEMDDDSLLRDYYVCQGVTLQVAFKPISPR